MAKRLLILDPEGKYSPIASVALKPAGWEVSSAKDFGEALDIVRSTAPDAMLCPVAIDGKDEAAIVKDIRAQKNGSALPVIIAGAKTHYGPSTYITPEPLSASALSILMTKIEARREDLGIQVEGFDQAFDSIMQGGVPSGDEKVLKIGGEAKKMEAAAEEKPEKKPETKEEPLLEKKEAEPASAAPPSLPGHLSAPETWVIKKPSKAQAEPPALRLEESWIVTSKDFVPDLEAYRTPGKKLTPPKFGLVTEKPEESAAVAAVAAEAAAAKAAPASASAEAGEAAPAERATSTEEIRSFFGGLDETALEGEGGVEELKLEEFEPEEAAAVEFAPAGAAEKAPLPEEAEEEEAASTKEFEESFEFEELEAVSIPAPAAVEDISVAGEEGLSFEKTEAAEAKAEVRPETPLAEETAAEPEKIELEAAPLEQVSAEPEAVAGEEAPSIGEIEQIFKEMYAPASKAAAATAEEKRYDEAKALELLDSHLEATFGGPAEPSLAEEAEEAALTAEEEARMAPLEEAAEETAAPSLTALEEEEFFAPPTPAELSSEEIPLEAVSLEEEEVIPEEIESLFEAAPLSGPAVSTEEAAMAVEEEAAPEEEEIQTITVKASPEIEAYFVHLAPRAEEAEEERPAAEPAETAVEFLELESPAEAALYMPAPAESLESEEKLFEEFELGPALAEEEGPLKIGEMEEAVPEAAEDFGLSAPPEEPMVLETTSFFEEAAAAVEAGDEGDFLPEPEKEEVIGGLMDFSSLEEELAEAEPDEEVPEPEFLEAPPPSTAAGIGGFEFESLEKELEEELSLGIPEEIPAAPLPVEAAQESETFDFASVETELEVRPGVLAGEDLGEEEFDFETAEEEILPAATAPAAGTTDSRGLDFDALDEALGEMEEFAPAFEGDGGFSFESEEEEVFTGLPGAPAAKPEDTPDLREAATLAAEAAAKSVATSGLSASLSPDQLSEMIRKAVEKAVEETLSKRP